MLFSEKYKIEKYWEKEWYNPWMKWDVELFLDPYLIENSDIPEFKDARKKLNNFFRFVINKIGEYCASDKRKELIKYMKSVLVFPEVYQLCLGYSKQTTKGAGTSTSFASDVYHAIIDLVEDLKMNSEDFTHVEVLAFFSRGVSYDKISDITANILKEELVVYTQRICKENGIQTENLPIPHFKFNFDEECWEDGYFQLPKNPYTREAILLVPKRFLRQSPTIGYNAFTKFLMINESEYLKNRLNIKLSKELDKETLIKIIKNNPIRMKNYVGSFYGVGRTKDDYYDYVKDKKFVYYPNTIVPEFLKKLKTPKFKQFYDDDSLFYFVKELVENFKQMIEKQGESKLLKNPSDKKPFKEDFIQDLFYITIKKSCEEHNIEISREPRASNGRIEFKFSQGHNARTHLEIKLASNPNLNGGYQKQLPEYMVSEKINKGIFLPLFFSDEEEKKIQELQKLKLEDKYKSLKIEIINIDGREKLPPSKLK